MMPQQPFDNDTYFQLLGSDPVAAHDYIDQYRYQHQNPIGVITEAVNSTLAQKEAAIAEQFLRNHDDFPAGDPDAAKAMRERVQQLVSQGLRFNETTMEYAYFTLVKDGTLAQEPSRSAPSGPDAAPQEPTREQIAAEAEKLSDADLEKLLRQNNMFR
jgi:hypothetical protein